MGKLYEPMTSHSVIEVENLSKKYCKSLKRSLLYGVQDIAGELWPWQHSNSTALRQQEFWALRDVSFSLKRGEALGVIGANGAGKSTLLKLLSGLIKPDAGQITVRGDAGSLLDLGAGFSPVLSGRENVYITGAIHGLSRRQVAALFDRIVDFAELWEFIDSPVGSYSSGMRIRLGYAVAAYLNPAVLLVDEVLAVGDQAFQHKCIRHMQEYLRQGGSLILVSHNMYLLQSICTSGIFIHQGSVEFAGTAVDSVNHYFEARRALAMPTTENDGEPDLNDNHPIAIESVEITPVYGEMIATGEDAVITIRYRSTKELERGYCGFYIWTADQMICITGNGVGFGDSLCQIAKGEHQFRSTWQNLPLNAGTYAIKAVIGDRETYLPLARYGWENAPTFFRVTSAEAELSNQHAMSETLMRIQTRWDE